MSLVSVPDTATVAADLEQSRPNIPKGNPQIVFGLGQDRHLGKLLAFAFGMDEIHLDVPSGTESDGMELPLDIVHDSPRDDHAPTVHHASAGTAEGAPCGLLGLLLGGLRLDSLNVVFQILARLDGVHTGNHELPELPIGRSLDGLDSLRTGNLGGIARHNGNLDAAMILTTDDHLASLERLLDVVLNQKIILGHGLLRHRRSDRRPERSAGGTSRLGALFGDDELLELLIQDHPLQLRQVLPRIGQIRLVDDLVLPRPLVILRDVGGVVLTIAVEVDLDDAIDDLVAGTLRDGDLPVAAELEIELLVLEGHVLGHLQRSAADGGAAVALGRGPAALAGPLVVEGQLRPGVEVAHGEDAGARNAADLPPVDHAVGIAGVVDVAGDSALLPRVDVHVVVEGHDVEHPLGLVAGEEGVEVLLLDGNTDVLADELPFLHGLHDPQAAALRSGVEHLQLLPLLALDALVAAQVAGLAVRSALLLTGEEDAGHVKAASRAGAVREASAGVGVAIERRTGGPVGVAAGLQILPVGPFHLLDVFHVGRQPNLLAHGLVRRVRCVLRRGLSVAGGPTFRRCVIVAEQIVIALSIRRRLTTCNCSRRRRSPRVRRRPICGQLPIHYFLVSTHKCRARMSRCGYNHKARYLSLAGSAPLHTRTNQFK